MLVLLQAAPLGLAPFSAGVSALVAALALALAGIAWRAAAKRQNRGLRLVAVAFLVFCVKNVFSAAMVLTHDVPHDAIELILSLFDLVLLLLLFAPFLWRKRA